MRLPPDECRARVLRIILKCFIESYYIWNWNGFRKEADQNKKKWNNKGEKYIRWENNRQGSIPLLSKKSLWSPRVFENLQDTKLHNTNPKQSTRTTQTTIQIHTSDWAERHRATEPRESHHCHPDWKNY